MPRAAHRATVSGDHFIAVQAYGECRGGYELRVDVIPAAEDE